MELPVKLFISYSHQDEAMCKELLKHLRAMERSGLISAWHDRKITAGDEWKDEINKHLESADIILLLISGDFINSDYCYDIEMSYAMKRHQNGEACVIPIFLRPCKWDDAPFSRVQGLPVDAVPVSKWDDQDEAYLNIAEGIRKKIKKMTANEQSEQREQEPEVSKSGSRNVVFAKTQNQLIEQLRGANKGSNQYPNRYYRLHVPRTILSNVMMWWKNGGGYTDDLNEAHICEESEVESFFKDSYQCKKYTGIPVTVSLEFNQSVIPFTERFISIVLDKEDEIKGNSRMYLSDEEIKLYR